jgi:hypothetical protein
MTGVGIALVVSAAVGVLIALAMFVWAAREDGRDQKRREAELGPREHDRPRKARP